jgi:hypothetical protein
MKDYKLTSRLDHIGMTASTLCALHCAIVPILITTLPLMGLGFLARPWLEWSMIILALLIGSYTLGTSYLFEHHRPKPIILLAIGFFLIISGHFAANEWLEAVIVPIGGLTIASAHFANFKIMGGCRHGHHRFDQIPVADEKDR